MIGNMLRWYRLDNHLSQAQMAEKLGVSPSYISSLERGVRNSAGRQYAVSHQILETMSSVMGIPLADLEKEARQKPGVLVDPLTDEEADIVLRFRQADGETKAMIRRLLKYMKSEDKLMDMEEIVRQVAKNGRIVVEDPAEENPSFKERMREYAAGLEEKEEEE